MANVFWVVEENKQAIISFELETFLRRFVKQTPKQGVAKVRLTKHYVIDKVSQRPPSLYESPGGDGG